MAAPVPIFESKPQVIGGAFTAENLILDFNLPAAGGAPASTATGAIVQRVNFTISRPINFIYEIGGAEKEARVYYVGGRRQGQATFERIVGGSNVYKAFLTNYGPLCPAAGDPPPSDITLTAKGGCNIKPAGDAAAVGVSYTLVTPRLTTVGASVSAQDIVIMENLGMMFLDLTVADV